MHGGETGGTYLHRLSVTRWSWQEAQHTPPSLAPLPAKPIADKIFLTAAYSRCLAYLPHFKDFFKKWNVILHFKSSLTSDSLFGLFLK